MQVEEKAENWEVNFYKSIAGQFQIDIQGVNLKKSKNNLLPEGVEGMGVFKVMEVKPQPQTNR